MSIPPLDVVALYRQLLTESLLDLRRDFQLGLDMASEERRTYLTDRLQLIDAELKRRPGAGVQV